MAPGSLLASVEKTLADPSGVLTATSAALLGRFTTKQVKQLVDRQLGQKPSLWAAVSQQRETKTTGSIFEPDGKLGGTPRPGWFADTIGSTMDSLGDFATGMGH